MSGLLKLVALVVLGIASFSWYGMRHVEATDDTAAEQLGWRLGTQAYTFRKFSFFEAVDKTASMGMKYIEMYPGQRVDDDADVTTHYSMSVETRQKIRDKLNKAGLHLVNYGVVGGTNEGEWRALFEFAKDMGIETIVSEPGPDDLDLVENLCEEFEINVAIHNHPKPSRYWNPDTVLDAVEGRSKRMGACVDTGHWMRSELDPIECLKKLEGRIVSIHLKDLNKKGTGAHDVPWGTGENNMYGMLAELNRQGFQGVFSVEYEYNWDNSVPEIVQSATYFNLVAAALDTNGYEPLFGDDLFGTARFPEGCWQIVDGVLTITDAISDHLYEGDIWTRRRYSDFVLDLEFKCEPETNSGVFIRCDSIEDWLNTAIEVQILQPIERNDKHNCGAVFDCLAPSKHMVKEPGEWNRYTIIAEASKIYVMLNGEQVIDMDLDMWTTAHKNPDGSRNKFEYAYKDMSREGHIGLQYHGHPVWFRNLKIKLL